MGRWDAQERLNDLVRRVRPLAAEMGGDLAVLLRRQHDLEAFSIGSTNGSLNSATNSFSALSLSTTSVSQVRNAGATFAILRRRGRK
jgi:hypothetical protein